MSPPLKRTLTSRSRIKLSSRLPQPLWILFLHSISWSPDPPYHSLDVLKFWIDRNNLKRKNKLLSFIIGHDLLLSSTYSHSPTPQLHTGQTPPTPEEWADQIGEKGLTNLVPMFFPPDWQFCFQGKQVWQKHNTIHLNHEKARWSGETKAE